MEHIRTKVTQIKDQMYFRVNEYTTILAQTIEPIQIVNEIYNGTYKEPVFSIYDTINLVTTAKCCDLHRIIESFELEGNPKGHVVPLPAANRDTYSSIRCSEPLQPDLGCLQGRGHPLPLWATCDSVSPAF